MKIVLFGGSGMLGKALLSVFGDNILRPSSADVDIINDYNAVLCYLKFHKPDVVINIAGLVAGILANRANPFLFYKQNQFITLNVLNACIESEIPYLLSCSSTCAYPDKVDSYPMEENQIFDGMPSVDNLGYGIAKRNIIISTQLANSEFGTKYGIIIPSNLYGANDRHFGTSNAHYVTSLIHKLLNAKDNCITVGGTGKPMRQFTYVNDVARAIKCMVENQDSDILNCASPENMSILDLAQTAINANNLNCTINLDANFPDGQFRKDASSEKLISKYDFKFTDYQHGIKETYEWYKQNYTC